MAPRKLIHTADSLWEMFVRVTNELGEGNENAHGITPLHPTGHWREVVDIEHYAKKVFALEALQAMRGHGWLEQGMRVAGIQNFWVLERIIAAAMEYSAEEYESLMQGFFTAWERDLKPDGRTNRNKDQWIRWCELHLSRHHRTAKAERVIDVFHELGLLYPGWWKQIYAQLHGTTADILNYTSPWHNQVSIDFAETDMLNQKYARVPRTITSIQNIPTVHVDPPSNRRPRASRKQSPAPTMDTYESESDVLDMDERVETTYFADALEDMKVAAESANARDLDDDSGLTFVPEEYFPDWVHGYDSIMGRPATTYPQLAHTVALPPAATADAWRTPEGSNFDDVDLNNPQLSATRIVDSVSEAAVPHTHRLYNEPSPDTTAGTYVTLSQLEWVETDERAFRREVDAVEADFPSQQRPSIHTHEHITEDHTYDDHPEWLAQSETLYRHIAQSKNVPNAEIDRRLAERARRKLERDRRLAAALGGEVTWNIPLHGGFPGPPGRGL